MKPAGPDGGTDAGCVGQLTCECRAGGSCDVGECVSGVCSDCRRGEAACVCRSNGACNAGLRCEGNTCSVCPAGEQDCPCNGGACNAGLTCANGSCVPDTCSPGVQGCPCRAGAPRCDGAGYCDSSTICRACAADVPGCACDNGACLGGLVCETGHCREAATCADLVAAGTCAANQECTESPGVDATCTANTCATGYYWNGVGCVACAGGDCSNIPSCNDTADGGLGADCAAQHRLCVAQGETGVCGDCLQGFTQNGAGACIPAPTCGAVTCSLAQYCDRSGGAPACLDLPCDAGTAMPQGGGACTACAACNGPGYSGRVWPIKLGNNCVCETLDNYFIDGVFSGAQKCDADDDGWVNSAAANTGVVSNPVLSANSRCQIRSVDRVRLFDEYGTSIDVLSCASGLTRASRPGPDGGYPNGGLQLYADGGLVLIDGGSPCVVSPMRLLETTRNDTGLGGLPLPAYATGANGVDAGRPLAPMELNLLTKACVTAVADFDDDAKADFSQTQQDVTANAEDADLKRLRSFAYFVELAESYWEPTGSGNVGVLVIKERNRCNIDDADFPLRYASGVSPPTWGDGFNVAANSPYWRSCARNRYAGFNAAAPKPNTDFAQWSCTDNAGACLNLPPPAHPTRSYPGANVDGYFRQYGLCQLGGAKPADGLWRGLNHHSQFKCVAISSATSGEQTFSTSDFNTGYVFDSCVTRFCANDTDPTCRKTLGSGAQTRQPVLDCVATGVTIGYVGFAAKKYQSGAYLTGCVDEGANWGDEVCPYPAFSDGGSGSADEFGRFSCYGKKTNWLWAASDAGAYNPKWTMKWSTDAGRNSNDSGWSP